MLANTTSHLSRSAHTKLKVRLIMTFFVCAFICLCVFFLYASFLLLCKCVCVCFVRYFELGKHDDMCEKISEHTELHKFESLPSHCKNCHSLSKDFPSSFHSLHLSRFFPLLHSTFLYTEQGRAFKLCVRCLNPNQK